MLFRSNLGVTGVYATTLSSTGNANVGNLGTGGLITATGNITGGNVTATSQLVSSVATGTAPIVVSSTNKVANLYVDRAAVGDTLTVATQNSGNYYVGVWSATSGNLAGAANANFVANLSTGALYATTFIGNLVGNIVSN